MKIIAEWTILYVVDVLNESFFKYSVILSTSFPDIYYIIIGSIVIALIEKQISIVMNRAVTQFPEKNHVMIQSWYSLIESKNCDTIV